MVFLVVMGPCGCGKSQVGEKLGEIYGCPFLDADAFHSKENVEKMGKGCPLNDQDRIPWLNKVREEMLKVGKNTDSVISGIVGCSALKVMYRNVLRNNEDSSCKLIFVLLDCSGPVLEKRLEERRGHFMKTSMLHSQLQTLERPGEEEASHFVVTDGDLPLQTVLADITNKVNKMLETLN